MQSAHGGKHTRLFSPRQSGTVQCVHKSAISTLCRFGKEREVKRLKICSIFLTCTVILRELAKLPSHLLLLRLPAALLTSYQACDCVLTCKSHETGEARGLTSTLAGKQRIRVLSEGTGHTLVAWSDATAAGLSIALINHRYYCLVCTFAR